MRPCGSEATPASYSRVRRRAINPMPSSPTSSALSRITSTLVSEEVEKAALRAALATSPAGWALPEDEPFELRLAPEPPEPPWPAPLRSVLPVASLDDWELNEKPPDAPEEELADEWPLMGEWCLSAEGWWWPGWRGLPSTAAWPA
jgi:hypothetical protein